MMDFYATRLVLVHFGPAVLGLVFGLMLLVDSFSRLIR